MIKVSRMAMKEATEWLFQQGDAAMNAAGLIPHFLDDGPIDESKPDSENKVVAIDPLVVTEVDGRELCVHQWMTREWWDKWKEQN